jgi:site-specific recombinase XerD
MQLELWNPSDAARQLPHARRGRVECEIAEVVATAAHSSLELSDELDARVSQYVLGAQASRTRAAYRTDWLNFERWCADAGETALPASSRTLARYLTHLAALGRKTSTIRRARVAIGVAHGLAGEARPDRDPRIRALERGIGRAHGVREEGPDPLVVEHLAKLIATAGKSARDCRDRAMLLLGFAGAYRASDLATINIENLSFNGRGMTVLLTRSKEDQLARGAQTEIPYGANAALCPVTAVREWLSRVGRPQGPLFRVVAGTVIEPHRIHPRAVTRAVQRFASRADLSGHFSAHSLRSGFATSAYARGASGLEIQDHGRWKDPRSLERYIHVRHVSDRRNVAARVL